MKEHLKLLGMTVEDKVTGFAGVVTSIDFDLYGCVQAVVQPAAKDGKYGDPRWFDVKRLVVTGGPVMAVPSFELAPGAEAGPSDKPLAMP